MIHLILFSNTRNYLKQDFLSHWTGVRDIFRRFPKQKQSVILPGSSIRDQRTWISEDRNRICLEESLSKTDEPSPLQVGCHPKEYKPEKKKKLLDSELLQTSHWFNFWPWLPKSMASFVCIKL